jgi:type I restriction enzyme S subunit
MSWQEGEAPEGWKLCELGDVASIVGGGTPKTSVPGNFSETEGHPWVTPADLTRYTDKYISRGRRYLTDQGLATSSAKYIPAGSVLFSTRAPIGYVAVATNPVTTNQGFRSFVPNGAVDAEYIYYALKFLKPLAEQMASGTTFAELSGSNAAKLPIAYPSPSEQRAIVCALDLATEKGRTAATHLSSARRAVERFRQAVLAAACSGRLTSDWRARNVHRTSAAALLRHIHHLRSAAPRRGKLTKSSARAFSLDVPNEWALSSLDALSVRITSGSRDWSRFYGRGTGTFVMAQNVRPGRLDWSYRQAVDPPLDDQSRSRSQVEVGDLLVTIVGANTGDVGPVTRPRPEHYVCQSVALIRPADPVLTPFLNLWFGSPGHGRGYFDSCLYGAGRPHLSFDQLKSAPVAIPSLAEQEEISRRVEHLYSLADALDDRLDAARRRINRASQAVLTKAFRGDLVNGTGPDRGGNG